LCPNEEVHVARFICSAVCIAVCGLLCAPEGRAQTPAASSPPKKGEISFQSDVFPVIKKNCLPCHAEDQYNPSELSLDSYDLLMAGGKHGVPVAPGLPAESLVMKKLNEKPPFGDRMPLDPRKKRGEKSNKKLTDEELRILTEWISQGAKNN
jgi:Planctomycete cytochrome C